MRGHWVDRMFLVLQRVLSWWQWVHHRHHSCDSSTWNVEFLHGSEHILLSHLHCKSRFMGHYTNYSSSRLFFSKMVPWIWLNPIIKQFKAKFHIPTTHLLNSIFSWLTINVPHSCDSWSKFRILVTHNLDSTFLWLMSQIPHSSDWQSELHILVTHDLNSTCS